MGERERRLGASGERRAVAWYRRAGYEIVARNWRPSGRGLRGELDVVARRGDIIVICEVKTRSTDRFGSPIEAITREKAARIRRLASAYLADSGVRSRVIRFDVAEVRPGSVTVVEGAF
ncbi:MAG TPA: YraN family protein [Acidimicrobiales bacterium]